MNVLGSFITNIGHKLVLMAMVLIIAGCQGTSRYERVPLLTNAADGHAGKGVVVARVVTASSERYPFNELDLIPKNFNQSKEVKAKSLVAKPAKSDHSVIFAGAVKPGSYSLGSMTSYHSFGEYYYVSGVRAKLDFGTFSVEEDKVTDLGTIIYYPKSQEDSFLKTLIRVPSEAPGKLINQYFSYYDHESSEVLTWDEDGFADERESAYLSAAQNPVYFTREYLADDGYLYMLAPLGVILVRTPDGEWYSDAVDGNLPLRSIAKNAAGDLIVGGDEGKVFVKRSGGELWEDISINYQFDVQEVAFDDANNMLVIASKETYMGLFKSQENIAGMAPNWQIPLRFNSYSGWFKNDGNRTDWQQLEGQERIMSAKIDRSEDGQILSVFHQNPRTRLVVRDGIETSRYTVNLNDLSFERIKKKLEVDFVIDAGAMQIGVEKPGFFSWSGKPSFYIKDKQTREWEAISTRIKLEGSKKTDRKLFFKFVSAPWFSSPQNGVAIAYISKDKKPSILQSTNGGLNWTKTDHKLPKDYCVNIVSMITDRLLLSCDGATGDFYESTDNGKTWEQVREHEQF